MTVGSVTQANAAYATGQANNSSTAPQGQTDAPAARTLESVQDEYSLSPEALEKLREVLAQRATSGTPLNESLPVGADALRQPGNDIAGVDVGAPSEDAEGAAQLSGFAAHSADFRLKYETRKAESDAKLAEANKLFAELALKTKYNREKGDSSKSKMDEVQSIIAKFNEASGGMFYGKSINFEDLSSITTTNGKPDPMAGLIRDFLADHTSDVDRINQLTASRKTFMSFDEWKASQA